MKMTNFFYKAVTISFVLFVFLSLNNKGLHAQESSDLFLTTSKDVLKLIRLANFKGLSKYVHESRGLKFSPYDDVYESGFDTTKFDKQNVKNFMNSKKIYNWGIYDGSGLEIKLTPREYYKRFIYDIDFEKKSDIVFVGNIESKATEDIDIDLKYIFKTYPNATIVHHYYKGSSNNGFCDFKKLTLIFEQIEKKWFLVGIIHGEQGV